MSLYGISFVAQYVAWDTVNNVGKTGDVANHTLSWVKDGTRSATTNSPTEVDSTNCPGLYKVTLTATEAQCTCGTVSGKSSSTGIVLIPVSFTFQRLPNVDPATNGGLPTVDASNQVKANVLQWNTSNVAAPNVAGVPKVDIVDWLGSAPNTLIAGRVDANAQVVGDKTGYALSSAAIQAIWDYATSLLTTAGSIGKLLVDNINATISSRSTLDAAAVRTAVGLASANLDTQFTNIPDNILDKAAGVETSWTLRQALRIGLASWGGSRSGFSTNSPIIQNPAGTKNRITSTNADTDGNATVVLDAT